MLLTHNPFLCPLYIHCCGWVWLFAWESSVSAWERSDGCCHFTYVWRISLWFVIHFEILFYWNFLQKIKLTYFVQTSTYVKVLLRWYQLPVSPRNQFAMALKTANKETMRQNAVRPYVLLAFDFRLLSFTTFQNVKINKNGSGIHKISFYLNW